MDLHTLYLYLFYGREQDSKHMPKKNKVAASDNCQKELAETKEAAAASEMLHRNLIDYMHNGYACCRVVTEKGRPVDLIHVEVNKGYENLTGLKNVIGRKITEVIPGIADSNPELLENHFRVVESGIAEKFEIYIEPLHKWYESTIYCPEKGYTVAIFDDITKRKQAEQALQNSEKKFRSITEQMSEIVFITDSSGQISFISPAIEKITDYKPHEVIGQRFTDFLSEEEVPSALSAYKEVMLKQSTTHVIVLKFMRKNGTFFFGEVHVQYYHESGYSGTIGVIHDISERNRCERTRIEYEKKLLDGKQFLQNIYDTVNHSVFVIDVLPDGSYRYKSINRLHEIRTGLKNEAISGKSPREVLEPDVAATVTGYYDRCIHKGSSTEYEETHMFKGKLSWWRTILNPVRNDSGHIYRIIGTSTNITEHKLTEEKLKTLSFAIQQSPTVVVITDPEGNIEYINPTFTEHTGYTEKEVIGQNPRILKSGLMEDSVYEEFWKTILAGNVWHGEFHNKKKNGELYWEDAIVSAIVNQKGVITNFVAVKEDITEKKKLWVDLIASKEKAEESDRLKTAFLANISHEIRTPMNGILGFAELLKEPHLSGEEQAEYIELINQSGKRMLALINDIVDISRIEAGETMIHVEPTHVNKLLHSLCTFFRPLAANKNLLLSCNNGLSDEECVIETDSAKLTQILTNLVQNGLKFSVEGEVRVGYIRKEDLLEFSVSDSGIGIPESMKESIFERFRQVDNSLTRHHEGSGLGLSISKAYVEMLGGTIRVESGEGNGSTFIFTLPFNPPGVQTPEHHATVTESAPGSLRGTTILLAEDDAVSRILIKRSLQEENLTILDAWNGRDAVQMIMQHPEIDLVLMDIKMPVMNGFEASREIKKLRPELPIIAQTAFTSKEERLKALEAGCDSFMSKPINKQKLIELIRLLLHK
ncbi:PAS:Response regulator receiver:ATP-binding region, ATPase-like:Histidine kinase A-like [Chlorobium ferrooxidans DSM 13031]|uniref:histidine kinase n=2 Tax=Chlorobium TaxID=1091 RepID=Q0YP93_9CHLB|nr:PAS:Response regulator receiver:ATP-binding region, ATPase-like:Histidine kinase A-like [Chlorobium ferrooxidans DSM 13031]